MHKIFTKSARERDGAVRDQSNLVKVEELLEIMVLLASEVLAINTSSHEIYIYIYTYSRILYIRENIFTRLIMYTRSLWIDIQDRRNPGKQGDEPAFIGTTRLLNRLK